jgi:RecB family exonuclease
MAHDERHARARGATLDLLDELASAHEAHGNRVASFRELVSLVRRAVERQTFTPMSGVAGVRLMEARAARYAQAKALWVVGLVEGEWPAPSRGSIFYPTSMLLDLGFAREQDRLPAARAAFLDLLSLPSSEVRISSFQLEDDAIVRPSVFLEDLQEVALEVRRESAVRAPSDQGSATLSIPGPSFDADGAARPRQQPFVRGVRLQPDFRRQHAVDDWASWRTARRDVSEPRFRGYAGPPPARVLSVTEVERYLECPFRYFATYELRLQEEEDEARVGLDPRTRGTLVHDVFQRFFDGWSAAGRGAIAPGDLGSARTLFAEVVDTCLAGLPEADRVLERTRLLGSAAAPGLGERVFRLEALRPTPVVERLLEFNLRGTYTFEATPPVRVELRGKADRIDLLADGTLRLIDYKTGRAPDRRRAVQLAVYALCAEQRLDGYRGRRWTVGQAAYLALADKRPWIGIADGSDREALDLARDRFLGALDGIARGEFPPRPADPRLCLSCPFSGISRKEGDVGPGRP